jgi:hypothetical protein
MIRTLMRGALAGAAGTTALNAVTYADMTLRGRPSSDVPERSVETLLDKADLHLPGDDRARRARLSGLGALSGIAVGTGIGALAGVAAAVVLRTGARPPLWTGGAVVGALAMAATDIPMARSGISDPRTWSAADWLSDVVPHAAYGLVTYAALARERGNIRSSV